MREIVDRELPLTTLMRVKKITLTFPPSQNTEKVKLCVHVSQISSQKRGKQKKTVFLEVSMYLSNFGTLPLKFRLRFSHMKKGNKERTVLGKSHCQEIV